MWTRRFCNFVLHILFKILLKLEVVGLENVPPEGPLILAITHTNFLDPVLAGGVMPREVVVMSKIENFRHPILGITPAVRHHPRAPRPVRPRGHPASFASAG